MAFTEGFYAAEVELTVANLNACLLGWGPKADFPAAAAGNKGRMAWATDEALFYYSDGSAWVALPFLNTLPQTIAGVKTFSSIPVLPASDPTTDNQAARKAYVDTKVKSASGSYVGDGGASKSITGLGFAPKFVLVDRQTASKGLNIRATGFEANIGYYFDETSAHYLKIGGAGISTLDADGFTVAGVGTGAYSLNENGRTFYYVAYS